jgi:hypothetical protein
LTDSLIKTLTTIEFSSFDLSKAFDHELLDTKCEGSQDRIRRDGGQTLKKDVVEVCSKIMKLPPDVIVKYARFLGWQKLHHSKMR